MNEEVIWTDEELAGKLKARMAEEEKLADADRYCDHVASAFHDGKAEAFAEVLALIAEE